MVNIMKRFAPAIVALSFALTSTIHAQTKQDEEAVHNLPRDFFASFNKHDGHELAQIMTDDVDFVTVGAMLIHGKSDFEKYHTRLLDGRFHGIIVDLQQVEVRFLTPDVAVVHCGWAAAGDKNPDGTSRQPRCGLMTMVVEKRADRWLIAAAQNDNSIPGLPPECEGMTSPMPMPNQVGPRPSS